MLSNEAHLDSQWLSCDYPMDLICTSTGSHLRFMLSASARDLTEYKKGIYVEGWQRTE